MRAREPRRLEVAQRVDDDPADDRLEVDVRARADAGAADAGDPLAGGDGRARRRPRASRGGCRRSASRCRGRWRSQCRRRCCASRPRSRCRHRRRPPSSRRGGDVEREVAGVKYWLMSRRGRARRARRRPVPTGRTAWRRRGDGRDLTDAGRGRRSGRRVGIDGTGVGTARVTHRALRARAPRSSVRAAPAEGSRS